MSKPMYYVYHVPGIKVGMTKDLGDRVFEQQGYDPHEVELLYVSRDMEEASQKELEYQKALQYPVDRQSYKDLMNKQKPMSKFKINITDMTTTFPCYARELESYLMDNRGRHITLHDGTVFIVADDLIKWCKENARTSMYNNNRCYVYNKALTKAMKFDPIKNAIDMEVVYDLVKPETSCDQCIFPAIREWANERGLYEEGDIKTQFIKMQEEAGELARAIIKADEPEIVDAIGDIVVVLTNLAHLAGHNIEDCIASAYDVISKRKGSMINGSFVKNETL
jgi:NTP pyrophosphatase (non-canonical NTP hydrolase)